jgi:dihydrofolate reductase
MRRLILQTGISIDGYVAALDHSHPWGVEEEDESIERWVLDSVWAAGAHLMGRVTYEEMAAHWPTSTSEYARPMNEIPKVVFSKTLQHADWPETRIARGDLADEIGRLKREPGNDLIAYGGATLDQALSRLGLVDEYRLMIQPAALGGGLPLFKDLAAPLHLELVEATTYPTGVAIHVYRSRSTRSTNRWVSPAPRMRLAEPERRPLFARGRLPTQAMSAGTRSVLRLGVLVEREDCRAGGAAGDCALKCGRRVGQRESRPNVE